MGLLDDAIREHLELKRLRGADPSDVAREEQAVLGPVRRGGDAETDGPSVEELEGPTPDGSPPPDVEAAVGDSSTAGQETIEINMEAEFAASASEGDIMPASSERTAPVTHPADSQAPGGESLEWEMPGARRVQSMPGKRSQDDMDFGVVDEQGANEPVEDVLEETPDFLRDTPEQERLWFEQRPPRDFDFNE